MRDREMAEGNRVAEAGHTKATYVSPELKKYPPIRVSTGYTYYYYVYYYTTTTYYYVS